MEKKLTEKKMFTRQEFEQHLIRCSKEMAVDEELRRMALEVLIKADHYDWIHQTKWLGEPILNLPQDMFAIQEIIYKTKPKFIVEAGVAWGGSLLFYSTLLEILDGEKVIGIDVYIPNDLKERIGSYNKLSKRIEWIKGSSIEPNTFNKVKSIVGDSRDVMVILDSYHTHEHAYNELKLYEQIVGKGYYIICGDTIVEHIPKQQHRPRPWGPGNNPKTAVEAFLKENRRFKLDKTLQNKLLFTCNPGGYLYAIEDK